MFADLWLCTSFHWDNEPLHRNRLLKLLLTKLIFLFGMWGVLSSMIFPVIDIVEAIFFSTASTYTYLILFILVPLLPVASLLLEFAPHKFLLFSNKYYMSIQVLLVLLILFAVEGVNTRYLLDVNVLILACFGLVYVMIIMMYRSKAFRINASITLVMTLICLLILEGCLRLIMPQPVFDPQLPFLPHQSYTRHIKFDDVQTPSQFSTNKWGVRGDAVPNNWQQADTIIAIGGSTTIDYFLDDDNTWTAQLQDNLNVVNPDIWIGNAGLDGHTTRGHLVVMKEVVENIKPDAVMFLVGINDLGLSLRENFQSSFDNARNKWYFSSQLYRLYWTFRQVNGGAVLVQERGHQEINSTELLTQEPTSLPYDLRDILPSLIEYRENLESLLVMARNSDIEVLFFTQPILFEDNAYWSQRAGTSYWITDQKYTISAATYRRMLDLFNAELLDFCQTHDVPCYDLASDISGNNAYFYDIVHFTDLGAAMIGEVLVPVVSETFKFDD